MDGARLPELVDFALLGAKPSELRTPIGLLGRCPLTLSLRSVVLDYFRGVHVQAPDDAESCAAPGVPQPVFDASDRRFATEGALGVSRGLYPSANQAAKSLVEKYGLARTRTAAAQSGKIFGASPEAAVDRIGREIKKHLRSGMSR